MDLINDKYKKKNLSIAVVTKHHIHARCSSCIIYIIVMVTKMVKTIGILIVKTRPYCCHGYLIMNGYFTMLISCFSICFAFRKQWLPTAMFYCQISLFVGQHIRLYRKLFGFVCLYECVRVCVMQSVVYSLLFLDRVSVL